VAELELVANAVIKAIRVPEEKSKGSYGQKSKAVAVKQQRHEK
jgi:hypothetical protein